MTTAILQRAKVVLVMFVLLAVALVTVPAATGQSTAHAAGANVCNPGYGTGYGVIAITFTGRQTPIYKGQCSVNKTSELVVATTAAFPFYVFGSGYNQRFGPWTRVNLNHVRLLNYTVN